MTYEYLQPAYRQQLRTLVFRFVDRKSNRVSFRQHHSRQYSLVQRSLTGRRAGCFVGRSGHDIIGYILFYNVRPAGSIQILDLYVKPSVRRRGVGTTLVTEVQRCLSGPGDRLFVDVAPSNQGAISFYESVGLMATHMSMVSTALPASSASQRS